MFYVMLFVFISLFLMWMMTMILFYFEATIHRATRAEHRSRIVNART